MKKKYLSYYFKTLMSLSFAFLVPFLVAGFLLYSTFMNTLDHEMRRVGENFLKQSVSVVDTRFEEMNRVTLYISQLSFPSAINHHGFDTWSKYQEIKSLLAMNLFIDDLYIYLGDNDTVYSTRWAIKRPYFFSFFKIKNFNTIDMLEEFLNNLDEMTFLSPAEVTNSLLHPLGYNTCIYPLPSSPGLESNRGCVLFFFSRDALDNILPIRNAPYKINLFVYERSGKLIYSAGENTSAVMDLVSGRSVDTIPSYIKADGQRFAIYKTVSAVNGWTYMTAISNESVQSKLGVLKITLFMVFVGILFFGVFILIILTRFNYRPVREILSYIANHHGEAIRSLRHSVWQDENEFSLVQNAFSSMSTTITALRQQVEYWRFNIKESLIADLLNGKFSDIESFNKAALPCGMSLEECCFVVIVITAYPRISPESEGLILQAEEMLSYEYGLKGYGAVLPPGSHLAFVLSGKELADKESFDGLLDKIKTGFFPSTAIGVGSICHSVKDIGMSYIKAVSATDYHFFQGKSSIIFFDRLSIRKNQKDYSRYIEALENAMSNGNADISSLALDELFDMLHHENMPVFQVKTVIFDILTIIKRLSLKTRYPLSDELLKDTDIFTLAGFNQVVDDDIKAFLWNLICEICEETKNQGPGVDLAARVNEYIEQHYSDPALSIRSIADHFGSSASNLAHNYKNITGSTVLNTIRNCRIARARELLENSCLGIQETGSAVGYDNLVTFVRNFRQCTGLTPSEYREKSKKQKAGLLQ